MIGKKFCLSLVGKRVQNPDEGGWEEKTGRREGGVGGVGGAELEEPEDVDQGMRK